MESIEATEAMEAQEVLSWSRKEPLKRSALGKETLGSDFWTALFAMFVSIIPEDLRRDFLLSSDESFGWLFSLYS